MPDDPAREVAARIIRGDARVALDTLSREELESDPQLPHTGA